MDNFWMTMSRRGQFPNMLHGDAIMHSSELHDAADFLACMSEDDALMVSSVQSVRL